MKNSPKINTPDIPVMSCHAEEKGAANDK